MPPFLFQFMAKLIHNSICFLLLLVVSCRDVKKSEEYQKVVMDRDSLAMVLEDKEVQVKELSFEFDKIEKNLSAIDTNKTHILKIANADFTRQKERIHELIADIYIALDQNKTVIRGLEKKLKSGKDNIGMALIIQSLKKTLLAKESEIMLLEKELSSLKLEVMNLQSAISFKEKLLKEKDTLLARQDEILKKQGAIIAFKEAELNRVYYIRGTAKELESTGIVKKAGGIAGLGSVKVLGEKIEGDKMRTLNAKTDKLLLIGRYKKKKVISNHPSDSYFFIAKDGQFYLKISFPEKFWSLSKYLVVVVE
jgi:hypothetical protein